ncbi:hypothetical protein CPAR01_13653 [Colletotrichum paranaense]|uniref:Uncharacterized protein n=1 Tax=Colletotrichum paranaense TaxID=1914294 RepID=A0ABQ9S3Z0_9PEZI|nr:uncharacterized protein CPAR01_13653 [Colletotrichum paranaense]KAK1524705.1 hypothetical protein CPAR01_13653 [Colletotrichum paranaense]
MAAGPIAAEHDCVASAASVASATGSSHRRLSEYRPPWTSTRTEQKIRIESLSKDRCGNPARANEGERGRGRSTPLLLVGSQRTATQNGAWSGLFFPYPFPWRLVRTNAPYCTPDSDTDPGPWPAQARKAWMVEGVWNGLFAHRVDPVGRESRRDAPKLVRCQSLPEQAIDAPAVGEVGSEGVEA